MMKRTCTLCAVEYSAQRSTSKYCSPLCVARAREARRPPRRGDRNYRCLVCDKPFQASGQRLACSSNCRSSLRYIGKATEVPWKQCQGCGLWLIVRFSQKLYCSERCSQITRGRMQRETAIEYGCCVRCGASFIRRAGWMGAHCSLRCSRATRKRNRKHIHRTRSKQGERITLRGLGERDGWRCHLCHRRVSTKPGNTNRSPSVDHLIPISAGGSHTWQNVALAHRECNSRRCDTGPAQLRLLAQ